MRLILLTAELAAQFDEAATLDPREIMAGEHRGKFALPERVLSDPVHSNWVEQLAGLPIVDIDPSEAWPPAEDK